jgi:acetyltransferase-like isoleucine patch superfamily enzyme
MERKNVRIHPTAEVSDLAEIGEDTRIWHQAQIRERARIGKRCNIGKGVYIDIDVVIGDGCKAQNYVCIYHGVRIGNGVFLGPHMTFTNDLFPRAFIDDFKVYGTVVGDGVSICTNATIVCGHTIGEYAMVGAGAVVTKDVPPHALVYGNPARIMGYVCVKGHKMKKVSKALYKCDVCGEELVPRA